MIGKAPHQIERFVQGRFYHLTWDKVGNIPVEKGLLKFLKKDNMYRFVWLAKDTKVKFFYGVIQMWCSIDSLCINDHAIVEVPKDELPMYMGYKTIFPAFGKAFIPSTRPRHARTYRRKKCNNLPN